MRKTMILAVLMLIGALQGFCQDTDNMYYEIANCDTGRPRGFWGVRVNLDITAPGEETYDGYGVQTLEAGPGLSVGMIYNAPINRKFYFEPGVYLQYHTTNFNKDYIDVDKAYFGEFGVRVPLLFGFKIKTRTGFFAITTGPAMNLGLSGKVHVKDSGRSASTDAYDTFKRFDLNWNVGCAIYFKKFMIGLNTYYGMLNQTKDTETKWHQNYVTIGFGYNFR